jgi:thiamine biosynthesis protein ThiI
MSGGIDSPVASYLLMKRGADLTFLHYKTNDEILKKVKNLINIIESYAPKSLDLIVEDHRDLLKNVIINLESMRERKWTCVFCRYSMLKGAEEIARGLGALAICTGESLGQVASQTLNNISVENIATNMPVLRPLIGLDKIEIENIARKIGTFNTSISIKGCGCPFLPIHPITSASIDKFIKLRDKALKLTEKEYSEVFEKTGVRMDGISLISGGKDSIYAMYIAMQQGIDIKKIVNIIPEEFSFMYHFPNVHKVD